MTLGGEPDRAGRAPWIEGALLAGFVLAIQVLGGEAVRASYHGYLHATIGEAVLRDGLTPENPYHAGAPLRYYTLYPLLGVLVGRLGVGPLWGFALLNALSALLLAPALDALGRALGLSFRARRACFVAAAIGFNGLGWIGFLIQHGPGFGFPPVYALAPMTLAAEGAGWDARLQAFPTKFLNVSSFPLALPFGVWALACCAARPSRPGRAVLPWGIATGVNPLVGAFVALCAAGWLLPEILRDGWERFLKWLVAGVIALAIALPFLLPGMQPAPGGPLLTGDVTIARSSWLNAIAPPLLLFVPGVLGLRRMESRARWRWILAGAMAAGLVLTGELPASETYEGVPLRAVLYKIARVHALLWAIPAGLWIAEVVATARGRALAASVVLACAPTTAVVPWAYLAWAARVPEQPVVRDGRRFAPKPASVPVLFAAESRADPRAVVVMPPVWPGAEVAEGLVQGNPLTAVLRHALFVDSPQTHNERIPDLADRLVLLESAYFDLDPTAAVAAIRERFPARPTLWFLDPPARALARTLEAAGAEELAATPTGFALRSLPPLEDER